MTQETEFLNVDSMVGDGMGACEKETFGGINPSRGLQSIVEGASTKKSVSLHKLCQNWLKKNFNITALARHARIKKREDIDRALNLVTVKFDFVTLDGEEGDSVAFLNEDEILLEFLT